MLFLSWIQSDSPQRCPISSRQQKRKQTDYSAHSRLHNFKEMIFGQTVNEEQELTTPVRNITSTRSECDTTTNPSRKSLAFFWKPDLENNDLNNVLLKIELFTMEDIDKLCSVLRREIQNHNLSVTEAAELIQDVYRKVGRRMRKSDLFHDVTLSKGRCLMNNFEERLMKSLYDVLFPKIVCDELDADERLSSLIDNLNWVTTDHLAAHVDASRKEAGDLLDKAMLAIAAINLKDSCVEKLDCIMECSRRVTDALRASRVHDAGADEFFPVLVYVILQANPANLHSNIRFILQFSNSETLMSGEPGYYFTHLCSSVCFIENLNANSFGLSEAEYLNHLKCGSIKCPMRDDVAPSYSKRPSFCICKLYHNLAERSI